MLSTSSSGTIMSFVFVCLREKVRWVFFSWNPVAFDFAELLAFSDSELSDVHVTSLLRRRSTRFSPINRAHVIIKYRDRMYSSASTSSSSVIRCRINCTPLVPSSIAFISASHELPLIRFSQISLHCRGPAILVMY